MDNEGIITQVTSASVELGWFLVRIGARSSPSNTQGLILKNGWPINTKVASLIIHGKNILGLEELSNSFYGGLARALATF